MASGFVDVVASVIIPAYNAEARLPRCLDSLLAQTRGDFEVLVVDDGSADGTLSVCHDYAERDARIVVLHQDNGGVSSARNHALSHAQGAYLLFVDSDDYVAPTFIESMVGRAEREHADVVVCEYLNEDEATGKAKHVVLADYPGMAFTEVIARDETLYGGFAWNKLIRRDVVSTWFREDLAYCENLVFLLSNTSATTKYAVVHEPLYHYCIHKDSAVHRMAYEPKMKTILPALEAARALVPASCDDFYKYLYVNRFAKLELLARDAHCSRDLDDERVTARTYAREVVRSNALPKSLRAKAFLMRYVPVVYEAYMRLVRL